MLQLYDLSITHLELFVSLVQLSLEVVNIALGGGQLVLSMLQLGAGVVKEVDLEITVAVSPHRLVVQLLDAHLKTGVLLNKLSVALLNVLDGVVLSLYLVSVLLQPEALVATSRRDLLKQQAHVLGVACRERPTRMVGRKLEVANGGHTLTPHRVALILNGEQGENGIIEDWQVALTELHEGLMGSSLQSVIEIVAPSHGEPSRHGQVSGMSRGVHVDLAAPMPELTIRATAVRRSPHVAKAVQHVPEQDGKIEVMQLIATEPSINAEDGVGALVHLSKTKEK
jgi:hypothetical protein